MKLTSFVLGLALAVSSAPALSDRANIIELTDAEVRAAQPHRFFKKRYAQTPAIPDTYAGKYVSAVLVATNVALTEAQMNTLETEVEAITGVHKAFVLIGPARIPIDRRPVGYDLYIGAEAGFKFESTLP